MEILSAHEYAFSFYGTIAILVIFAFTSFGVSLWMLYGLIHEGFNGLLIIVIIVFLPIGASLVSQANQYYHRGIETDTEYKVTITDFNVLHNEGYEIIEKEGKIYTVKKVYE